MAEQVGSTSCKALVRPFIKEADPIAHHSNEALIAGARKFRIRPDDNFEFRGGHLLIEYEDTKRPVESISKYWWLFYKTEWPQTNRRIALVFFLVNLHVDQIRSESVNILGGELEKKFPTLFSFFFVPPNAMSSKEVQAVLRGALAKVR